MMNLTPLSQGVRCTMKSVLGPTLLLALSGAAMGQDVGGVTFRFFQNSNGPKPDLITRIVEYSPGMSAGASTLGSVGVWSGQSATMELSVTSSEPNDLFGFSASSAGDIDGDGVDDLVIGAPLSNVGGLVSGRVDIYSTQTGQVIQSIAGTAGQVLGASVAGLGDVDGDGIGDIVASGVLSQNGQQQDAVYVYSGATGAILRAYTSGAGGGGGAAGEDGFGALVRGLGDLNGDGSPEVAIVASRRGTPGSSLRHAEIDIINTATIGDQRLRLVLAEGQECVLDVNVVAIDGTYYLDVVTMAAGQTYSHVIFDMSGLKDMTATESGDWRFKDVNKDNVIDQDDVWLILDKLTTEVEPGSPFKFDVNKDGVFNAEDLVDVLSATTNAPILDELSAFAQNRIQELNERYPLYFGLTEKVDMSAAELKVEEKREACKECPPGQVLDCANKCCGPGEWTTVEHTYATTPRRRVGVPNQGEGGSEIYVHEFASINDAVAEVGIRLVRIGSVQASGSSQYEWNRKVTWTGPGPSCSRAISHAASGGLSQKVNATVGPATGNSAFANAGGIGTCSSVGNASATCSPPPISVTASVTGTNANGAMAMLFTIAGNVSPRQGVYVGAGVKGTFSAQDSITSPGQTSGGGTGLYAVELDREHSESCTDKSYWIKQRGTVEVQGNVTNAVFGYTNSVMFARASCDIKVH